MDVVHDVDRPDVNGVPPKMKGVRDEVSVALSRLSAVPYLTVTTDDNLMSSVWIKGSFQPRAQWEHNIFQNSPYFQIRLCPAKGQRYYEEGADMEMELCTKCSTLSKLRRYTGPLSKILPKLEKWILSQGE